MGTTRTRTLIFAAILSLGVVITALALLGILRDDARDATRVSRQAETATVDDSASGTHVSSPLPGGASSVDEAESPSDTIEDTTGVETPDGPPSLRGTVRDLDGKPIEGAAVALLDSSRWQGIVKTLEQRMRGRNDPREGLKLLRSIFEDEFGDTPRTESAEDGAYAFHGLIESEYRVFASHPAHLRSSDAWGVVQDGTTTDLDIELAPGHRIAGRVTNAGGDPVPDATVHAYPAEEARQKSVGKLMRAFTTMLEGDFFFAPEPARSTADGSFEVVSVEPIDYVLRTSAAGLLTTDVRAEAGSDDVVIRLQVGGTVTARVLDPADNPAVGASWKITPRLDVDMRNPMAFFQADFDLLDEKQQTGMTDEEGTFRIAGLARDSYELTVDVEDYPQLSLEIDVSGNEELGDLRLEASRRITGVVRGADGSPVANARVWIPLDSGVRDPFGRGNRTLVETHSEPGGGFVLDGLSEGSFAVHAESEAFAETVVDDVKAGTVGIEIRLDSGLTLSGLVLDAESREPVEGVNVSSPWVPSKRMHTDAAGRFELRGISVKRLARLGMAEPRVFLQLQHPDYARAMETVEAKKDPQAPPHEILLKPRHYLSGIVVDPDGEPVSGARVRFEVPGMPSIFAAFGGGGAMAPTTSGRDGTFEVSFPQGNTFGRMSKLLELTVEHPRYAKSRVPLSTLGQMREDGGKNDSVEIEIELYPGLELQGHVRDEAGTPITGARLQLSVAMNSEQQDPEMAMFRAMMPRTQGSTIYSRTDGSYRFGGLEEGPHRLTVNASGFVATQLEVVVAGSAPVTQDVTVTQGGNMAGRVLDQNEQPLAGVEVLLSEPLANHEEQRFNEAARMIRKLAAQGIVSAKSNEDGEFVLEGIGDDHYDLIARAPGYVSVEVHGVSLAEPLDDLILERLGNIGGRVTEASTGSPVVKFEFRLVASEGSSISRFPQDRNVEDAGGEFFFDQIQPGRYTAQIRAEGFAAFTSELEVRPGQYAELNAALHTGGTITVVVQDTTGTPIPGAMVQHHVQRQDSAPRFPFGQHPAKTGEDGSCELASLSDGEYSVSVSHPDFYATGERGPVTISVPVEGDGVISFSMKPAGRLQGTIVGLPELQEGSYYSLELEGQLDEPLDVSEASLVTSTEVDEAEKAELLEKAAEELQASYKTSATLNAQTGSFSAASLPPGTYQVRLRQGNYSSSGDARPVTEFPERVTVEAGNTGQLDLELP